MYMYYEICILRDIINSKSYCYILKYYRSTPIWDSNSRPLPHLQALHYPPSQPHAPPRQLHLGLPRVHSLVHKKIEPRPEISNNVVCATSKASDQPAHTRSLIRAFASRLTILHVKLLAEHHLEFLSLKGGHTGSSE